MNSCKIVVQEFRPMNNDSVHERDEDSQTFNSKGNP